MSAHRFYPVFLAATIACGSAYAESADRKDYMLQALQEQRNAAMDREALCRGDTGPVLEAQRKQVADLQVQLADAKKKIDELADKLAKALAPPKAEPSE